MGLGGEKARAGGGVGKQSHKARDTKFKFSCFPSLSHPGLRSNTHARMFISVNCVGSKALNTSQYEEGTVCLTVPHIFSCLIVW